METLIIHILYFADINLLILVLGYVFIKHKLVFAGWVLLTVAIIVIYFIFLHDHPIVRMISILATLIFFNENYCRNRELSEQTPNPYL